MKPLSLIRSLADSSLRRPFSKLYMLGDGADWVLSWEIRELARIASRLGVCLEVVENQTVLNQCVFYADKRALTNPWRTLYGRRVAFPYYHGDPRSGEPSFVAYFKALCRLHAKISRIQVSHTRMQQVVLDSGIAEDKVHLIPIAVNSLLFSPQTDRSKALARIRFGVPESAVVVGSFQKDGVGWGEGRNPKLIKGPDVFVDAVAKMQSRIPELFVLLSGPARGYVKQRLRELGIPFKHINLPQYEDIGALFHCLDLYIIASREEGGPKAVLETMLSGVPLVTTRVGQAMDLVVHEENGYMCEVEDSDALAYWGGVAISGVADREKMIDRGVSTALANTHDAHMPLWRDFFAGFVGFKG